MTLLFSVLGANLAPAPAYGIDEADIEQSHSDIADSLFSLTDQVDEFFDDVRTAEQREDDWVRLGIGVRFNTEGDVDFSQRGRASFNLTPFSEKLRLIVGGSNTDTSDSDEKLDENRAEQSEAEDSAFGQKVGGSGLVGLSYTIFSKDGKRLVAEGGYRLQSGLSAFTELRASIKRKLSDNWSVEPTQFLEWNEQDGFGEKTRLEFNRALFTRAFFRSRSELIWTETSEGADVNQELGLFREFGAESFIALILFTQYDARPAWSADVWRVSTRVKSLILGNWLYGEIEPFLEFPDSNEHDPTPGIALKLDAKFSPRKTVSGT